MAERSPAEIETKAKAAKQLIRGSDYKAAENLLNKVLVEHPDDQELLYILAVAQRYQCQYQVALSTLKQLQEIAPSFGRAYQEAGYNHEALENTSQRLSAFERAVTLDPALIASWKVLMGVYQADNRNADYEKAAACYGRLQNLPGKLVSVSSLINEGRLFKAEQLCREFLRANPQHIEAMRLLADIGVRLHVYDDAEFLLESVLEFQPDYHLARLEYASVLRKRRKFDKALLQAEMLIKLNPEDLGFQSLYANVSSAVGDHEKAIEVFRSMLKKAPLKHEIYTSCGHALKTVGRLDEAVESYRAAYGEKRDYGDAFWSLANLKTYKFTQSEMIQARASEAAKKTSATDRIHLCFALGKAYEDSGEYDCAFEFYQRGNRLKLEESKYSMERNDQETRLQIEFCTRELFERTAGFGCPAKDPIFIVGLPRSGSTLIEQILASHSQVEGTLELPNIITCAHKLNGRRKIGDEYRYPSNLVDLKQIHLRKLGETYISDTQVHRSSAPFFTDKMPNNYRHIGLIHMILPNAKIIDARRHPMAACFSGFKQLFAEGQEFTYGLREAGDYYRKYVELMDHWDAVLPGRVLRVQYEDVVADLEQQVRRILDYCGLEFEQSCVDFHETDRAIRTPSSEQVRQPIYQGGLEQWRNFEQYLDPLTDALGPILDRFSDPQ